MSVQLRTGKSRADGSPIALSPPENLSTRLELFRKGIHLAAIPCIWFVFWQDAVVPWLILVPGSAVALLVDYARIRNVSWVHRLLRPLHQLFRRSEHQRDTFFYGINGATWLVVTVALGSLLFSGPVVTLASTVFLLGDAVAALVGRAKNAIFLQINYWVYGRRNEHVADTDFLGRSVTNSGALYWVICHNNRSLCDVA
jgi:dolichol kinase